MYLSIKSICQVLKCTCITKVKVQRNKTARNVILQFKLYY